MIDQLLMVSRSMPPDVGGYQRQFELLVRQFERSGVRVTWVGAVRDPVPKPVPGPHAPSRRIALPTHRIPRRLRGIGDPLALLVACFAALLLRARGPIGVILLSPGMLGSTTFARFCIRLGVPVLARFATAGDELQPRASRTASLDGVTAIAPFAGPAARGTPFVVHSIPNAVRQVDLPPQESDSHSVVCVGRLIARKRVDWLLDAWAEIEAALPSWTLTIVGDGGTERDSTEEALKAQAARLGLRRARFIGRVSNVEDYLREASLLVMPSEREGMPNVVLEALAIGTPVLADPAMCAHAFGTDVPLLHWSGERDELASAIRRAIDSPDLRSETAASGQAFAQEHHSPEEACSRLLELLDRTVPVKAGWSRFRIPVRAEHRVLDVGARKYPNARADVLCDISNAVQAAAADRPFVQGDATALPFKEKAFKVCIASHLLEHVPNPEQVLAELHRVASKVYIETPHSRYERAAPERGHLWAVTSRAGSLYLTSNPWQFAPASPFRRAFRFIYFAGVEKAYPTLTLPGRAGKIVAAAARAARGILNRTGVSTTWVVFDDENPPRLVRR